MVAIRDLVDILILVVNSPTTLIEIHSMMMPINCVIGALARAMCN